MHKIATIACALAIGVSLMLPDALYAQTPETIALDDSIPQILAMLLDMIDAEIERLIGLKESILAFIQ